MTSSPTAVRRILGGILIALGVLGGVGVLFFWSFGVFDAFLRVDAPGAGEVALEPGKYAVYWESPLLASRRYKPPFVHVEVEPRGGGTAAAISYDPLFALRYSTFTHQGAMLAEFDIEKKGDYRVLVAAPQTIQERPGQISITRGMDLGAVVRLCVIPFTLFWGGVGSGLFLLLTKTKAAGSPARSIQGGLP